MFLRRQNPGIELTENGLNSSCKRMVESCDALHESLESQTDQLQGSEDTGAQTLLEHFIIPYFVDFAISYPRINVGLKQLDDMFFEELAVNELYFTSEIKDDTSTYTYIPYHDFVQKLWASENYLKRYGAVESIKDLYGTTFCFRGAFSTMPALWAFHLQSDHLYHNEMRTFDLTGTRTVDLLCQEGLGIMNGSEETTLLSGLNVKAILPKIERDPENLH